MSGSRPAPPGRSRIVKRVTRCQPAGSVFVVPLVVSMMRSPTFALLLSLVVRASAAEFGFGISGSPGSMGSNGIPPPSTQGPQGRPTVAPGSPPSPTELGEGSPRGCVPELTGREGGSPPPLTASVSPCLGCSLSCLGSVAAEVVGGRVWMLDRRDPEDPEWARCAWAWMASLASVSANWLAAAGLAIFFEGLAAVLGAPSPHGGRCPRGQRGFLLVRSPLAVLLGQGTRGAVLEMRGYVGPCLDEEVATGQWVARVVCAAGSVCAMFLCVLDSVLALAAVGSAFAVLLQWCAVGFARHGSVALVVIFCCTVAPCVQLLCQGNSRREPPGDGTGPVPRYRYGNVVPAEKAQPLKESGLARGVGLPSQSQLAASQRKLSIDPTAPAASPGPVVLLSPVAATSPTSGPSDVLRTSTTTPPPEACVHPA